MKKADRTVGFFHAPTRQLCLWRPPGLSHLHGASNMAVIELNDNNFEETILNNDFVVIDFWAPWCGPCRGFAPVYEAAAEKHADITFAKVNTEEQQALAGHFQIRSIPTLMIFREKVIIYAQPGAMPAGAFDDLIDRARKVDMAQVHADIAKQDQNG
jgi:thioredoxin 1